MNPHRHNSKSQLIGNGTFGQVFLINSVDSKGVTCQVAQKKLIVLNKATFGANLREIDVASRLKHLNIITLYGVSKNTKVSNTAEDRYDDYCLDFELVASGDIYKLICAKLQANTYFSISEVKYVFTQCLLGIWYMHRNGYIHRDIKPTNILITADNIVKICDFGYSKKYLKYDNLTVNVASKYFRAPEVLLETAYGFKSDIWSLGCILHYLMSGGEYFVKCIDFEDLNPQDKFTTENPLEELRYIVGTMPYPITKDMFDSSIHHGLCTPDILHSLVRKQCTLTEEDFFEQHQFKMDQDNVISYEVLLFRGLLVINPNLRKSIDQLLVSKFLLSDDNSKNLICAEKSKIKLPEILENHVACSLPTDAYKTMSKFAQKVFIEFRSEDWYTDRILFMAIDIFSRVTNSNLCLLKPIAPAAKVINFFISCLYIAIKFQSPVCDYKVPEYNKLPFGMSTTLENLIEAKQLEDAILKTLNYTIYNTTLLDILLDAEVPEIIHIISLLLYITCGLNIDAAGLTLNPWDSYTKWESNSRYIEQTKANTMWKLLQNGYWKK